MSLHNIKDPESQIIILSGIKINYIYELVPLYFLFAVAFCKILNLVSYFHRPPPFIGYNKN